MSATCEESHAIVWQPKKSSEDYRRQTDANKYFEHRVLSVFAEGKIVVPLAPVPEEGQIQR